VHTTCASPDRVRACLFRSFFYPLLLLRVDTLTSQIPITNCLPMRYTAVTAILRLPQYQPCYIHYMNMLHASSCPAMGYRPFGLFD
jgi:hypothetical protein